MQESSIVWCKPIPNFEDYIMSANGMVWSRFKNEWLKIRVNEYGYKVVSLYNNKTKKSQAYSIHKLLYQTFVGEIPQGYQLHHKDFCQQNNDLNNLVLLTKEKHRQIHAQSQITKERASKSGKGKKKPPRSEQWRKKKSEAMKKAIQSGKYTPPSFKGHKHSQQTKYKMSQAHKK